MRCFQLCRKRKWFKNCLDVLGGNLTSVPLPPRVFAPWIAVDCLDLALVVSARKALDLGVNSSVLREGRFGSIQIFVRVVNAAR